MPSRPAMSKFHPLTIASVARETRDAIARIGVAGYTGYCASKAAVVGRRRMTGITAAG